MLVRTSRSHLLFVLTLQNAPVPSVRKAAQFRPLHALTLVAMSPAAADELLRDGEKLLMTLLETSPALDAAIESLLLRVQALT